MPTFKPKKEEFARLDKKTYRISKPDIEHIENDNTNLDDLTSDSSEDEAAKEEMYRDMHSKEEARTNSIKTIKNDPFGDSGYGDDKDKMDFNKMKVDKDDKLKRKFDSKIGDLLSNFKKMREMKFGRKEEEE